VRGDELAQLGHAGVGVVDDLGGQPSSGPIARAVKIRSFTLASPINAASRA
jgi:hypothetical protein